MPRSQACRPLVLALSLLGGAARAGTPADDWPQFRGPTGDGISPARNPPLVWSETRNVAWKVAVPGLGRSSPVILGDRIWLTTAVVTGIRRWGSGADDMQQAERAVLGAVCLDRATGRILWHVDLFPWDKPDPIHWLNSYATPTPAVEPGRLYCDFGTFGTACIDSETGKELWRRRLPLDHQVGPGSSPLLHGDLLVLVRDGRDQQYVTALDRRSGEIVWKASRPPIDAGSGDLRKSFSTPTPIEVGGRVQIVIVGAQWIVAYEPETGNEVWRVNDGSGFSVAPRPVHGNGMVYVCTGNTGGSPQLWAIRPDGRGDVTSTHVAWKLTVGVPMMPSPVLVGTRLFLVSDNGFVACVDALTGEIVSKQRAGGSHCASPVWAAGRLYVFRDDGKTLVLRADETLEILAENQLEGSVFASPAFVGPRMIFRTDEHLYAIEETAGAPAALARTGLAAAELAGHQLLVASVRTGDTEIFSVIPATGEARNLTRSPASEDRYPCWSPDGARIAFISDRGGAPNLFAMDADGGAVFQLLRTKAVCYMPSWAAGRIVFGMHGDRAEMASIAPDGTDLRVLGDGHDPCISPDGRRIAYTGDVEGGVSVFVMDSDGTNRRRLVPEANSFGAVFPSWSPDSRSIVYSFRVDEALELFVIDADGPAPRQLTRLGRIATPAAWSPDGTWISFRLTDERYWSDLPRMRQVYADKPADKRPVWVVGADGSNPHVIECLRFQCSIDGSRAPWRPAKTFPSAGAIPDQFPAEGGSTRTLAEDVYVIEEPRRTRDQLRALDAILPGGTFPSPDDRWRHLAKTLARLQGGKPLHVVNLGDSIVNDTARSGWVHRLRGRYPRSAIRMTTVVRGSTGCWWYKEEDRVRKIVVPLEPDLVFIGGLSQRGDADSIQDVVRQLRAALPEVDVLLGTAAFGRMDPLREETLPGEPCSGYGEYGARLRALAEEFGCGFVDVTRVWADYIRRSGWPTDDFKRDSIHANDRGEQILGRILDAHLSAPEG